MPIPAEMAGDGRRVPREAARRGRRDRRGADGALPRRRGARPAAIAAALKSAVTTDELYPVALRRRDEEPRHACAARPARRGRPVAGAEAVADRRRRGHGRRSSSRRSPTRSPAGSPASASTAARVGADSTLVNLRDKAKERLGGADDAAGEGAREGRRVRRRATSARSRS